MSNHHSQKSIRLHHDQLNASQARKEIRQEARSQNFQAKSSQLRMEYNISLIFGFVCFAYTMFATATYLGRLL